MHTYKATWIEEIEGEVVADVVQWGVVVVDGAEGAAFHWVHTKMRILKGMVVVEEGLRNQEEGADIVSLEAIGGEIF